jgi:hypothetical protein
MTPYVLTFNKKYFKVFAHLELVKISVIHKIERKEEQAKMVQPNPSQISKNCLKLDLEMKKRNRHSEVKKIISFYFTIQPCKIWD